MNKIINSKCSCGIGLNWINKKIIMLEPCEHIIHEDCYLNCYDNCPICNSKIETYNTEKQLQLLSKKNSKYYQKYVDIVSMKNVNNMCKINMNRFMLNIPYVLDLISRLPFTKGFDAGHKLCQDTLTVANVRISIIGKKNIVPGNKIIIANHTSMMDFIIMYFVFRCGFLASSSVKDSWLGKLVTEIIPILLIDRGKENNTVQKMKDYVKQRGSLCLFPEGIMVHPDTMIRFRTGAFYVNEPIIPVVISYNPLVTDSEVSKFIQKLASQEVIDIKVKILPVEYPPFNDSKMEQIRRKMAKAGNMALSRVSNKDIKDLAK